MSPFSFKQAGPTHELLTAGGQGVTHDTKGNMLFIPASVRANSSPLVLTWDFDNRMVSADVGADSVIDVTHQYDALGRRVARTASGSTTVFVQVDQQTISDYASGAAPASSTYRYLYGSYIDEPIVRIATSNSETTWYHRNQQYSIVACTDSSGAATERYAYTAYGLPTITDGSGTVRTSSAIGNRYTYTGREWDGTLGLYHYRARMYEATVGRFCSRDLLHALAGTNNHYDYVHNKPIQNLDPSGWLMLDLPAEPWKCQYAIYLMRQYATLRSLSTYDAILLDHFLSSQATDLLLPIDAFDHWGGSRRTLLSQILDKLDSVRRKVPCNSTRTGTGNIQGQVFKSITLMINDYTLSANYTWEITKKCHQCECSSLKGRLWIQFDAYDVTDFDDGKEFGWPVRITDRLINACNVGIGFKIRATSSSDQTISGCERGFSIPFL
jgi:RHS repeat-associated protein